MKVGLFVTCLVDLVAPEVGVATARVLRTTLRALAAARADAYVAPAGSCTTMVRSFARQLTDSPDLEYVAPRLYELSEFLAAHGGELRGSVPARRVAYHDSCHMLRELGLEAEPRGVLAALGAELVPLPGAGRCCGFGGTFAVRQPELSVAMADEKLRTLDGATTVCGADPSCLMHLRGRLRRLGRDVEVVHLAELLEEGTRGDAPRA